MALVATTQAVDNRESPRYHVRVYEDNSESTLPQVQAVIPLTPAGVAVDLSALSVTTTASSKTPAAPAAATVGTSSGLALAAGTYKEIVFTVVTAANVSLGFDATAVLNSGVTMIGRGSSYVLEGPITLTTGVNAIASVAATGLAIQAYT